MSKDKPKMPLTEKEKLEWIETFDQLSDMHEKERQGFKKKMVSKIKSNPFVPVGMIATTAALSYGLYSMRSGNKVMSQKMMRTRVLCQGFTIVALLAGVFMASNTKPTKG